MTTDTRIPAYWLTLALLVLNAYLYSKSHVENNETCSLNAGDVFKILLKHLNAIARMTLYVLA